MAQSDVLCHGVREVKSKSKETLLNDDGAQHEPPYGYRNQDILCETFLANHMHIATDQLSVFVHEFTPCVQFVLAGTITHTRPIPCGTSVSRAIRIASMRCVSSSATTPPAPMPKPPIVFCCGGAIVALGGKLPWPVGRAARGCGCWCARAIVGE